MSREATWQRISLLGRTPLLVRFSELAKQCDVLVRRAEDNAREAARINELRDQIDRLNRRFSPGPTRETGAETKLKGDISPLQDQLDQLHKPFRETADTVLAFVDQIRQFLRLLPLGPPAIRQIRDDLKALPLFSFRHPIAFNFSMAQAHLDMEVICHRLAELQVELKAERTRDKGPKPPAGKGKTGPKPKTKDHRKLRTIVNSIEGDWKSKSNLRKVCAEADRKGVFVSKSWPTTTWGGALRTLPRDRIIKVITERIKSIGEALPSL